MTIETLEDLHTLSDEERQEYWSIKRSAPDAGNLVNALVALGKAAGVPTYRPYSEWTPLMRMVQALIEDQEVRHREREFYRLNPEGHRLNH